MTAFQELIAVDHRRALEFFVEGLQDVSGAGADREELLYSASVLAHYAQVSTHAEFDLPAPVNLTSVFDQFILNTALPPDPVVVETAGAQCLLLTGFFEDQMRARHAVQWYASMGSGFFRLAASYEDSAKKARLLSALGRHFETWRHRYALLSRALRDRPYVITPQVPPRRAN